MSEGITRISREGNKKYEETVEKEEESRMMSSVKEKGRKRPRRYERGRGGWREESEPYLLCTHTRGSSRRVKCTVEKNGVEEEERWRYRALTKYRFTVVRKKLRGGGERNYV